MKNRKWTIIIGALGICLAIFMMGMSFSDHIYNIAHKSYQVTLEIYNETEEDIRLYIWNCGHSTSPKIEKGKSTLALIDVNDNDITKCSIDVWGLSKRTRPTNCLGTAYLYVEFYSGEFLCVSPGARNSSFPDFKFEATIVDDTPTPVIKIIISQ